MTRLAALVAAGACVLAAREPQVRASARQGGAVSIRAEFLRLLDRPRVPSAPSPSTVTTEDGYALERLSVASEAAERVPLLVVKQARTTGRRPIVVALHGTGGRKESMRALLERYAAAGFIGVSMDARHHGERAVPIPGLSNPYESAMLRAYRTGQGRPYLYDTVWDVMRVIDYLATRPDADAARIGVIGHSKGGTEAYLAAAADPRIAVVIPLIGVQSFGWSLRHASG